MHRDEMPAEVDGSRAIAETAITLFNLDQVRQLGPSVVEDKAMSLMKTSGVAGFWLHVDADVPTSDEMPAVDSPLPGGLSYKELQAMLVPLLRSDLVVGLEVTIYDQTLDPSGVVGAALAAFFVRTLTKAGYAV